MKTFINFIIKVLIFLIILLIVLFFASVLYAYIYSDNDDISIESAVSYMQSIGNRLLNFQSTDKNSVNIILDDNSHSEILLPDDNHKKNRYFYNQLNTTAKIIYTSLENNIDNLKKENYTIDFSTQFNDLLNESTGQYQLNKAFQSALDAFSYDYPELFYIDITKITLVIKSSSIGPITTYTVKVTPQDNKNYLHRAFTSEQEVDIAISKVENVRNNFIKTISSGNDYEKILQVHDALVNSLKYDSSSNSINAHNLYGSLVEKNVVCEGYAKAFKYLLDALNIENILVSGTATNSSNETESHMWNYVKLNGNWYGVDVTWDDPIIISGISKNNLRHDYFLKGNSTFIKSHVPSGRISDSSMLFSFPTLNTKDYK